MFSWGAGAYGQGQSAAERPVNNRRTESTTHQGGRKRGPTVARDKDGFITLLRGGKPKGTTPAERDDDKVVGGGSDERSDADDDGGMDYGCASNSEDGNDGFGDTEEQDDEEWPYELDEQDWNGDDDEGYLSEQDHEALRRKWEEQKASVKAVRSVLKKGDPNILAAEEVEHEAYQRWKKAQPQKSVEKRLEQHARKSEREAAKLRKAEETLFSFQAEVQPKLDELKQRVADWQERKRQNDAEMEKLIQEKWGESNGNGGKSKTDEKDEALHTFNEMGHQVVAFAETTGGGGRGQTVPQLVGT